MPVTLTDDPSVFPDIQAPTAGDGRDAVSVSVPFQRLANRTRQNKNRIDAIAPSTDGARLIRTIASIAALQAIGASDHLDGTYAIVEDYGLYRYDIDSLDTASTPFVVQPTDVVGGGTPGRWHLCAAGKSALNTSNGIAQCDSAGRVPAASVRNGIVGANGQVIIAASVTGPTLTDMAGSSIVLAGLAIGDIILVFGSGEVNPASTSVFGVRAAVLAPGPATTLIGTLAQVAQVSGFSTNDVPISGFYIVTAAGSHTVKLQASSTVGTSIFSGSLQVFAVRP